MSNIVHRDNKPADHSPVNESNYTIDNEISKVIDENAIQRRSQERLNSIEMHSDSAIFQQKIPGK
jgi:hypothetical protein